MLRSKNTLQELVLDPGGSQLVQVEIRGISEAQKVAMPASEAVATSQVEIYLVRLSNRALYRSSFRIHLPVELSVVNEVLE